MADIQTVLLFHYIACSPGFFGVMCKDTCSPHCLDPSNCDRESGECYLGCLAGWVGPRCDQSKTYCHLFCSLLKIIRARLNIFKIQVYF